MSRAIQRASVDLPEPDSPTMPNTSLGRSTKRASCTAFTILTGLNSLRSINVLQSASTTRMGEPVGSGNVGGTKLGTAAINSFV